ncbi:MAG TPA: phosphoadenylyl-sulfate reductase [Candidatus Binatia bacterium]|nr:phosphoadenylyl-sulfate reductase [Candidatus Binatia bacterium]
MLGLNTQELDDAQSPRDFEHASAEEVLRRAFNNLSPNIALACSFQAESSVLIDMLYQLRGTDFRVFTLDTGRLNQETYDCMEALRQRYGIAIEVYFPAAGEVEQIVKAHGLNLFYESIDLRKRCCAVRKVEPLKRALSGLAAWVTGLRREQTVTRTAVEQVERDQRHGGILKINPLADWTYKQVWEYIAAHEVPYNKLHDRGFTSIGCAPCTRAIKPWEENRAGRWWWEKAEPKECGLHV